MADFLYLVIPLLATFFSIPLLSYFRRRFLAVSSQLLPEPSAESPLEETRKEVSRDYRLAIMWAVSWGIALFFFTLLGSLSFLLILLMLLGAVAAALFPSQASMILPAGAALLFLLGLPLFYLESSGSLDLTLGYSFLGQMQSLFNFNWLLLVLHLVVAALSLLLTQLYQQRQTRLLPAP